MTRPLDLPDDVLTLEWATSPAGAWACGLIVTDGCLGRPQGGGARGNVSPRLRAVLKPEDRSGIESLADAFGIAHDRVRRTATGVSLEFGHPKLRFLVDGLGMPLGDKTSVARLPEVLVLNDHAWRGVIDGDGYVSEPLSRGRGTAIHLGLRSVSQFLLDQFATFVGVRTGAAAGRYDGRAVVTGGVAVASVGALYVDAPNTIARKRKKALRLAPERLRWERDTCGNAVTPPAARELVKRVIDVL